jgi:hypothetical protein
MGRVTKSRPKVWAHFSLCLPPNFSTLEINTSEKNMFTKGSGVHSFGPLNPGSDYLEQKLNIHIHMLLYFAQGHDQLCTGSCNPASLVTWPTERVADFCILDG